MIGFARHLHDDRLYECYVASETGDAPDPRAAEHLVDCARCHARYAELAAFMNGLRMEADAEIDEVYSADALHAQQAQIARRLEHVGHAARVISFPRHSPMSAAAGHASRITPRWVAAAAAAGLFIGVGVGSAVRVPSWPHARSAVASRPATPSTPAPLPGEPQQALTAEPASAPALVPVNVVPVGVDADDPNDEFFADLAVALERPRTSELRAFDDLTPHVREIRLTSRVR